MKWGLGELDTFVGDIWELATEAIVCPIHCEMRPSGQFGSDILRRAGHEIEKELSQYEHLRLGQVCLTGGGGLECEKLIHIAVTSLARRPSIEALEEALQNALMLAYHNSMRSVAIPATYNEPGELTTAVVARIIVKHSMDHLLKARFPNRIVLVVPTDYVHKAFLNEIERLRYGDLPA